MSITQQQIAENLGITRSLVGKALSGHPRVSEVTRLRVQAKARELGYDSESNQEARNLIGRRYGKRPTTRTLALITPAIGPADGEARRIPFFEPLYDGVEAEAALYDLDVITCRARNGLLPRQIANGGVDGIITLDKVNALDSLVGLGVPVVSLDLELAGAASVLPDERSGMLQLVRHLDELGHRRIAYVGHLPDTAQGAKRLAGYKEGLASVGLPCDERLIDATLFAQDKGGSAALALMDSAQGGYTALVCYNDWMAMGAIQALQNSGFDVPGQISVVGFDDISTAYGFAPAITSVAFDRNAMARRAVQLVREAVLDNEPCPDLQELFPVELVVRNSTRALDR